MRGVPSIVIDNDITLTHTRDLVPIVPPTENFSVFFGVLIKPLVCLSEVIIVFP